MTTTIQQPFNDHQNWERRVYEADKIWSQLQSVLSAQGMELPKTPRFPDARLVINNVSGQTVRFMNPGDHSKTEPEEIPSEGEKTAAMVMLAGKSLYHQIRNAEKIVEKLGLDKTGLDQNFAEKLSELVDEGLILEAYGAAPYEKQSEGIQPLDWQREDGANMHVDKFSNDKCTYGARKATQEMVFRVDMPLFVAGTETVAEQIDTNGIYIAVSQDWKTKKITTRPIVASVAPSFYGKFLKDVPSVTIDHEGQIETIKLNGVVLNAKPENRQNAVRQQKPSVSKVGAKAS